MHKYSQSGQDDWVLKIIGSSGYFTDWGAFDGIHYSNTLKLEEVGWSGLCIEANPRNFELLKQNRNCNLLLSGIENYVGTMRISDEQSSSQRLELDGLGGVVVPCGTIQSIFRNHAVPKYIDYISSDLERMDAEIWETFPFDEYSFGLATVEHCLYEGNNNFKERIMKVMLDNGYVLARENVEDSGNFYEDWFINPKLL